MNYKIEIKTSGDFENDPNSAIEALEKTGFAELNTKTKELMTYMVTDGGDPPEVVSKEIIKDVLSDNPNTRYPAGAATKMVFEARRSKNDSDFEAFVKEQFFSK